jgi:hypothetical protein
VGIYDRYHLFVSLTSDEADVDVLF